jgi:NTE family protein
LGTIAGSDPTIGLALSGGGSRAIAFHLGCLRALNERGVLQKVSVISAVSGGSVIAGMYAYSNDDFERFDDRVVSLLRRGLQWSIVRHFLSPPLLARVIMTNMISLPAAFFARLLKRQPPLRRWAGLSDALEIALRDLFGDLQLSDVRRPNLDIVFNACELRTATAFRFGNRRSGTWRFGEIVDNKVSVAHAIACSAAYPMFLPAFDRKYSFLKSGTTKSQRVIITDGGAFDNLGTSCLEPGRSDAFSVHTYPADYIICCYAGHGISIGPHRYDAGNICYLHQSFWNPGRHDLTFVLARAAKWLNKYEVWKQTRIWPGAEIRH